ncbi:uncharacterized protein LOC143284030 isoform X2 [Babylonia areolata]|uniref:uncharacterized protein LOC143284030 isoform X2 n=1 Tax=Babylonia areolata TaxID=304850 RepID=UPI003FD09397
MMSPNKTKKGGVAIRDSSPEPGPSSSKRAKRSKMSSDDEDDTVSKTKSKKAPSKYVSKSKRSPGFPAKMKPAELFRKDLISAMKLPDSEPLQEGSYILISDPWRQEWEKGVQVPVNMKEILQTDVREIREKSKTGDFKIPHKLLHERVDSMYKKGLHELTGMQQLSEQLVRYDLDDLDVCWLDEVNFTRREMGLDQINEWNMERVMEALENQCHEKMTAVMKTEEGMGIEYDEDIVCDVCCSPDSEDTNEMVFCDGCDVCIHQACYGIQSIPEGSWLCRTCALGVKPECILCPKVGGAMKSTRSGTKWAHVSCALWIPEVSIGIPEKMEPITKISNIPPSRWALVCCLCKERVGACIQCSVKTCKTAFHVTCGFSNGLEMKTVLDETDEGDGVKLKAYCPKHTKKRERGHSESDTDSPRKDSPPTPKKEMTQQERENLRAQKLKGLEEDFHTLVDVPEICTSLQLDREIVDLIFVYWKLKRKCNWDKALLTPKTEEADILEKQQEDSLVARMKMFVHLRQDLERVRNLCYMIGKREKTKRQFFRSKEYVFTSMVRVLLDKSLHLSNADVDDIVHNYHFDSIYDDYGLSVQHLPPEPSQDEDQPAEMEMKEAKANAVWGEEEEKGITVDSQPEAEATTAEEAVEEKPPEEPSIVEEEEVEEDPNEALPPGERWSGEFVRSGFFMRRRPKMWMKGAMAAKGKKRKLPPLLSSPEASAPAASVKLQKVLIEDDNVFTSNDESDEDKEKLAAVVKAIVDKSDDDSDLPQPVLSKLVVKPPKSKSHHHHHHRKRHRGRKPWHMKEALMQDLLLSSSEDEDMKVEPIPEHRKESCVVQEDLSEVVDVVGFDDNTTTSQDVIVDVEGDGGEMDTLQSVDTSQSDHCGKDHAQTVAGGSKQKRSDRSVQKLFDQVRKESEEAKSLQYSERTKLVSEKSRCVTLSDDTKLKSKRTKQSESVKKSEDVQEKWNSNISFNKVSKEGENSVKSDSSSQTKVEYKESDNSSQTKPERRDSVHRRRSSKSKLKSSSTEMKNTQDVKACEEGAKGKHDAQRKHEKSEEKRKQRESRHKHHDSSSESRRSRREHRKSRHTSNNLDSSTSRLAQIQIDSDRFDSDKSEPPQELGRRNISPTKPGSVHASLAVDDTGTAQKFSHKEKTDSGDSHSVQKVGACREESRKRRDRSQPSTDASLLPSAVREGDRQRTKKGKELSDKVKDKALGTAEPVKSPLKGAGFHRRSSSSEHPNIFERMERSTSSSSGHSSERSNIFESMERHCREGSLGLKNDGSERLRSHPSIDWPRPVEFHLGTSDEPAELSQQSGSWFSGRLSRSRSHGDENVKTSGRFSRSFSPLFDKSMKANSEQVDACDVLESVVESSDTQARNSPLHGDAGKVSDTRSPLHDNTLCLPSGNSPSEDVSCPASGDAPCLAHEDMLSLSSGGTPFLPDQDAPCLSKEDNPDVQDVPFSPSPSAPSLSHENVPSENVSSITSEEAPGLSSEYVPFFSGDDENGPSLAADDEDVPHLFGKDENIALLTGDDENIALLTGDDENVPSLAGEDENVPSLAGEDENVPSLAGEDENVPLSTYDHENVPLSTVDDENVPLLTGGDENVPLSADDHENVLLSTGGDENVPSLTDNDENVPLLTGTDENVLLSTGGDENVPSLTDGFENLPSSTDEEEEFPSSDWLILDLDDENAPVTVDDENFPMSSDDENVPLLTGNDENVPLSTGDDKNVPLSTGDNVNVPLLVTEAAPILSSDRVPCLADNDEDDVHIMDGKTSATEEQVKNEKEHDIQNDLQAYTIGVNQVETNQEVETNRSSSNEINLHIETQGVNGVDSTLSMKTEGANTFESELQPAVEGADGVQRDQPVEAEGAYKVCGLSADQPGNVSPVKKEAYNTGTDTSPVVQRSKLTSASYTTDKTEHVDSLEKPPIEILKIPTSSLTEFSSRQHRKRSHRMEDKKSFTQVDPFYQKSSTQPEEHDYRSKVLIPAEKRCRRSSVRNEEKHENIESSGDRVRHHRKSSHEARLKLSKVLAAPDSSSDDDFEPTQPMVSTFPKRQRHDRHSKKVEVKHRGRNMSSEDLSEGEGSDEDDAVERPRNERRRSHQWDSREKPLQKDFVAKSAPRTDTLKPELTKLLKPSDLIVEDDLVKRVEDSLLRRYRHSSRHSHVNGVREDKQKEQKMIQAGRDSKRKPRLFIAKDSDKWLRSSGDGGGMPLTKPLSKTRVLNEITPERSGNFQINLFGAHFSPRGSLSGYKIPKKSSSQSSVPSIPSSPQAVSPTSAGPFGGGAEFSTFRSLAAGNPHYMQGHTEGAAIENTPRKTMTVCDGASDVEATSTISSDQLNLDSCRDYRSGSPGSDTSVVMTREPDSRESTPRRCTRSQLVEELAENSPFPHGGGGVSKMKLRDSWLKASNFPS